MERLLCYRRIPHKCATLDEFVRMYINSNNPATYWADTKELQCDKRKNRSYDDLLLLCKNYFPETTIKELVNILSIYYKELKDNGLRLATFYCSDISKPVVGWEKYMDNYIGDSFINYDDTRKYNSQWSLNELEEMIDD